MPLPGLVARVSRAVKSLKRLERLAEMPWEEYSVDEDAQALAERHLHIVLESILDLAGFIVARQGLSRGPTYRDIVEAVVDARIIPPGLSRIALSIPGMRNLLVHGYAEIRHDIVYEVLREDLDRLREILHVLWREAERLDP